MSEENTVQDNDLAITDDGIMAIADTAHTSKKLLTDQEGMERLWQGVSVAVQRAQDSIPAAGINLLRGTRDFTAGKERYIMKSGSSSVVFTNGWMLNAPVWHVESTPNEFSEIVYTGSLNTNSINVITWSNAIDKGIHIGDTLTISFEVMVEDATNLDFSRIGVQSAFKNSDWSDPADSSVYAVLSSFGVSASNVAIGKWYRLSFTHTISNKFVEGESSYAVRLRSNCPGGVVRFRKVKCEKENIANPTWSASPFDVSEVRNAMTLDRIGTVSVTDKISLSDEQFKNPGRWAFSNSVLSNITDLPDLPGNTYINLITMRTWSDDTTMQIIIQPSSGFFCTRAIATSWENSAIGSWKYHYAS